MNFINLSESIDASRKLDEFENSDLKDKHKNIFIKEFDKVWVHGFLHLIGYDHIKNKDCIVFSDEYHGKSEGDPQYYLDLIFKASKRVGLDLNIYSGGLTDGKYIKKD